MNGSVARIAYAACFAAAALTTGAGAGQPTPVDTQVLFQPAPIGWDFAGFATKPSAKNPWLPKLPETKIAWLVNYAGPPPAKFSPPDANAIALASPINEYPLGNYLLRFDAGRNYDDGASTVTDLGQPPDAPNFRPLFKSKNKRSAFSLPYLGLSFTTPTTPPPR